MKNFEEIVNCIHTNDNLLIQFVKYSSTNADKNNSDLMIFDKNILLLTEELKNIIEETFAEKSNSGDSKFRKNIIIQSAKSNTNNTKFDAYDSSSECLDTYMCMNKSHPETCTDSNRCRDDQCTNVSLTCQDDSGCRDFNNCVNSGSGNDTICQDNDQCSDTNCINGRNNPERDSCTDNSGCIDNGCINDNGCVDDDCSNNQCQNDDCTNLNSCSEAGCIDITTCSNNPNCHPSE
jgi:hypothetical protein